ncbi:MAG: glycerate kinase, partial [Bacteroidota bacterium]
GKVVGGVAALCQTHQKPLIVFAGKNDLRPELAEKHGIQSVFSVMDVAQDTTDAMANGGEYLRTLAENWAVSLINS